MISHCLETFFQLIQLWISISDTHMWKEINLIISNYLIRVDKNMFSL